MDVLLVVDMQRALFETPRHQAEQVVANINRLAAAVRQNAGRVIFIQHHGTPEEGLAPHSDGWRLLEALAVEAEDTVIEKSICDAFYATPLAATLAQSAVTRLIVSGCASEFCVDTTIRSALSHGFAVAVVADGHTTADRPHLSAQSIVEHHNWVWQNLLTPKRPVAVQTTAQWLLELARPDA